VLEAREQRSFSSNHTEVTAAIFAALAAAQAPRNSIQTRCIAWNLTGLRIEDLRGYWQGLA
jgi:hypothetical protein